MSSEMTQKLGALVAFPEYLVSIPRNDAVSQASVTLFLGETVPSSGLSKYLAQKSCIHIYWQNSCLHKVKSIKFKTKTRSLPLEKQYLRLISDVYWYMNTCWS